VVWKTAFTGDGSYTQAPGPELTGLSKQDAIAAAIDWLQAQNAGHRTRSYRLRDWPVSRQRYWGEPFPIVYDEHGLPIPLPEDALPVRLPEMPDFRPGRQEDQTSDPVPPLASQGLEHRRTRPGRRRQTVPA
jgi:leucyl-tRNA synthetase